MFSDIPLNLTVNTTDLFVTKLNACNICIGNGDFNILIKQKLSDSSDLVFLDKSREKKAYIENSYMENIRHASNIRVKECDLLIRSMTRCQPCSDYRKTLSAMVQRVKESDADSSSYSKFTPNINLSKSQLKSKASDYARQIELLKQQREHLKKVKSVVEKESVELSPELEHGFCCIVAGNNDNHPFDPDSPQALKCS